MAKFLDTTGISYHLQQVINQAQEKLILISPYLKINERLRQSLEDKDRLKMDIRLVYGKSELQPAQISWLKSLHFLRTSFCENLHAKCYLNEQEAIITSMNLYEFSQVNNHEMGIYVSKTDDPKLYEDICNEARRLIRISEEVRLSVEKVVDAEPTPTENVVTTTTQQEEHTADTASCIRCKKEIPLNIAAPYCKDCYRVWKRYENPTYEEKYCLICGHEHSSTIKRPVCYACYQQNKQLFKSE